jgi:hypothetical protein
MNAHFKYLFWPLVETLAAILVCGFVFDLVYRLLFQWLPRPIFNLGLGFVTAIGVLVGIDLSLKIFHK